MKTSPQRFVLLVSVLCALCLGVPAFGQARVGFIPVSNRCTTVSGVTTCNFDLYPPNLPSVPMSTPIVGPAGPPGPVPSAIGATNVLQVSDGNGGFRASSVTADTYGNAGAARVTAQVVKATSLHLSAGSYISPLCTDSTDLLQNKGCDYYQSVTDYGATCVAGSGHDDYPGIMAAYNKLPDTGLTTLSGAIARHGRIKLPPGTCKISQPLLTGPFITYEGTGLFRSSTIQLADNVATTGGEVFVWTIDPVNTTGTGGDYNGSYATVIRNIVVDANGGYYSGHNLKASGLSFAGAQHSILDGVTVQNFSLRGFYSPANASTHAGSAVTIHNTFWVIGGTVGPGFDCTYCGVLGDWLSVEQVNTAGTALDPDGDPVPGIRIDQTHGGFFNVQLISTEGSTLPLKIINPLAVNIPIFTTNPNSVTGLANAAIIQGASTGVNIGTWYSQTPRPYVYATEILDRANGVSIPGNQVDYPSGSYEQYKVFGRVTALSGFTGSIGDAQPKAGSFTAVNLFPIGTATPSGSAPSAQLTFRDKYIDGGGNTQNHTVSCNSSVTFSAPYTVNFGCYDPSGLAKRWYMGTSHFVSPTSDQTYTLPGRDGTIMLFSDMASIAITTTAAASDAVTLNGITTSSHCTASATNSAASAATGVYLTKAANTLTLFHKAIAGMTFDVLCTAK